MAPLACWERGPKTRGGECTMSATTVDRGEGAATAAQVEGLVEQCSGLHEALKRARMVRRILLLGLLAFFVVFGWLYWQLINRVRSTEYMDSLVDAGRKRLEE